MRNHSVALWLLIACSMQAEVTTAKEQVALPKVAGLEAIRTNIEAGAHDGAGEAARELLTSVERKHGAESLETALVLDVLVNALYQRRTQESLEEARHLGERAIVIKKDTLGDEHADLAVSVHNLGRVAYALRDYVLARYYFEWTLAIREKVLGHEHPDTARSLNILGAIAWSQSDYQEAQRHFKRVLAIRETVFGPEHPDTAKCLHNLGSVALALADHKAARSYFERALAALETVLGAEHPDTTKSLQSLGLVALDQADYETARRIFERTLAIRIRVLGPEHPTTAATLTNLGSVALKQADHGAAQRFLERALAIYEETLGSEHPNTAKCLDNLGAVAWDQKDYEAARRYHERALSIRERVLGPEHRDTANSLNDLGSVARMQADYEVAHRYFKRALSILETVFGPEHLHTARSLHNLGTVALELADHEAARRYFERALTINEKTLGSEHPNTAGNLSNLGAVAQGQGDYETARRYFERTLTINENGLGAEHPLTAATLNNLGTVAGTLADHNAAQRYHKRALTIRETIFGPSHPETAGSLAGLGAVARTLGDYEKARRNHERALAIRKEFLGAEHPDTAKSLHSLGLVALELADYETARSYFENTLAINEKALGADHPNTAWILDHLGVVALAQENRDAAWSYHERALATRARTLGPEHPESAISQRNLARTLLQLGNMAMAFDLSLQAESTGRRHSQLIVRTLDERRALGLAAVRPRGLDIAISVCSELDDSDRVRRTWDELVRSRALVLDEMAARRRTIMRFVRQADKTATRQLVERSREATRSGRLLANLVLHGPGDGSVDRWQAQVEMATTAKEQAERALAEVSSSFSQLTERRNLGLNDVQQQLKSTDALVAFLEYSRHATGTNEIVQSLSAFVLPANGDSPVLVSLGPTSEIESLVRDWRGFASRPPLSTGEATSCWSAGDALRRAAWDPVRKRVGDAQRVFIVADGALQFVSFAALPSGDGRYLVEEDLIIHPLSAERDLVPTAAAVPTGDGLLAMGGPDFGTESSLTATSSTGGLLPDWVYAVPETVKVITKIATFGLRGSCTELSELHFRPLRHAHQESWEIAKLWRRHLGAKDGRDAEPAVHHSGPTATEREFKRGAPGRRVLHLATHGFFLGNDCGDEPPDSRGVVMAGNTANVPVIATRNPLLLSGLALANANRRKELLRDGEDGILTAEEVASLDLSGVEWAVLSACETAVGDVRAGEGVLGLQRAFRIAGARTLVMSLWQVDDRWTREWMRALYKARVEHGLSAAECTREASRHVLSERRDRGLSDHPFYWGAFVSAGSDTERASEFKYRAIR